MYLLLRLTHLVIIIISNLRRMNKCEEGLKFKITLPEYICDKNGSVREVNKDMTTIRLLGKDATALDYKFDVNFIRIGRKCRNNQRCTLMAWKAVRELDEFLKNYPNEEKQTGLIQINNTMLLPGIRYILNVTILDQLKIVDEEQFSLNYVDNDAKELAEKLMASMLLLGSDTAYAYMTYVINAEITICSNISRYYFCWELLDDSMILLTNFDDYTKGAQLEVPPNTFQALKSYTITCNLIDASRNVSIANSLQTINILSKGLLLALPFRQTTTEPNKPLIIKAFTKDLDNLGHISLDMTWSCIDLSNNIINNCNYYKTSNSALEPEIELSFPNEGRYKIVLEISKGDFVETDSCEIEVLENVPTIEFSKTLKNPVSPSSGIIINTYIYKLRTFCMLQWMSVNQDGFEFLDLNTMPGNVNNIVNITLKEDLFLHELEEFSNGTIDREYNLVIPPPKDSWMGLKGDVHYMFRLTITCPMTIQDSIENENETIEDVVELIAQPPLVIHADVDIKTNAGPILTGLDVSPVDGLAFATSFSFKTQKAYDRVEDSPILYQFGYILDGRSIIFASLSDVTNTDSILPYSDTGLQTYLVGCDNFNSCNEIMGPEIKTRLPNNISEEYNNDVLKIFTEKMTTQEYYKAFSFAFSLLSTYKSIDNQILFDIAQSFITNIVNDEIEMWLNYYRNEDAEEGMNEWKTTTVPMYLIRTVKEFSEDIQLSETCLNNLQNLRNKFEDDNPEKVQYRG